MNPAWNHLIMQFGSVASAAKALGCSTRTIYRFRYSPITPKWIHKIELVTKFKLRRQLLNPEYFKGVNHES